MNKRAAFTLVELTVVLLLMGLMAGMTLVKFASTAAAANQREVIDQLRYSNHLARELAQGTGQPIKLIFDLDEGSTQTQTLDGKKQGEFLLPSKYRFEKVLIGNQTSTYGQVPVLYASQGCSPTYALELQDGHGTEKWLLCVGMSGQFTESVDEKQITQIFKLQQNSNDTH